MKISDLEGKADILSHVLRILQEHEDRINALKGEGDVPAPDPTPTGTVKLKSMFGINAYPWNFTQDPKAPDITDRIFQPKFDQIKAFSAVRHYIDRHLIEEKQGVYTFQPTHRGSWNLDLIFEACHNEGILNLPCLKEAQKYLYEKYPEPRDSRMRPATFGVNPETAIAYIDTAKLGFQFAARYGANKEVPLDLLKVDSKPRWTADPVNKIKVGLGTVTHMECDNERDIWWAYEGAKSSPKQYAAQMSAFYDGHLGTLGKDVGVKTADPNMIVVMGGLATASVDYVMEIIQWCNEHRGGSLPFDVINYHQYSNDSQDSGQWGWATRGVAPELRNLGATAEAFVKLGKEYDKPVWMTETGYDVFKTPQSSNPIGSKSAEQVQSDWIIRTALLYARKGVDRVFFYQLFDDNAGSGIQYSSSGLGNRPVMDAIKMFTEEIGDYTYSETISVDPFVDVYVKGSEKAYVCFYGTETGKEGNYTLNGKTIKVTETPIIVR